VALGEPPRASTLLLLVSRERQAIEHPLWVDFSDRPVPPLAFLLQREHSPAGVVERLSPGVITSHSPWYSEITLELIGIEAVAVLYVMSKDDESALLMACLDDAVEPFFDLLTGADFGDGVTRLTARHWPEVYAMLRHSNDPGTQARVLCNVATPGRVQWAVADHLGGAQPEQIENEQILDLIGASLQTFQRVVNFPVELPGLIQVLGGPDRTTRRLTAVAGLLGATSDIGQSLQGGLRADELLELAQAALGAVDNMLKLKD
jgi:hypothetical protein